MERANIEKLRSATPGELILKYGKGAHFTEDGVPVVIAARNEEANVSATLASLAENTLQDGARVYPIVVENGSTDNTASIAHEMGATVIHSEPFEIAALQQGVALLRAQGRLDKPVLFTDGDSIVAPTWVNAMDEAVRGDELAFAAGRSKVDHGPSVTSDLIGNFALRFEDIAVRLIKGHPVTRGDNTALNFANNQEAIEWYLTQDPRRFVFEDSAIGQELLARGARFVKTLGRVAEVSSLGDRYKSVLERIRILGPNADQWLFKKYENDYPGIIFGKHGN